MTVKERFILMKILSKVYCRKIGYDLGIIRPEIRSREYVLNVLRKMKEAYKRRDSLVKLMESTRYEIASAGTIAPKELVALDFDTLINNTIGDFMVFDYEIYELENNLTENLYADSIELHPDFSKRLQKFEDSLNHKIVLLKHLNKLTRIPYKTLSNREKKELKKEMELAIR